MGCRVQIYVFHLINIPDLMDENNQVLIQNPKFKIHGKTRGISSHNNPDIVCQHFGFKNYIEGSLVTKKIFFPKDVVIDEKRRFKTFQTNKNIPQIKQIACMMTN